MATQHASVKRLRGPLSKFIVDGFNFCEPHVRHYFLTHAHSDHTTGLTASFDLGEIYCSGLTAKMIRATIGVKAKLVHSVEVGETIDIEGVHVTALDAGHCPGAVMFLFEDAASGHRTLHTGDCRASEVVVRAAAARIQPGGLDLLYLDTTYAQPRWDFPSQPDSLAMLGRIVRAELEREPATLLIVGSYQVGKEKAIEAVTRAAGGRALVPPHRATSLRLCGMWDDALHTEVDAEDVRVHVAPMMSTGQNGHEQMASLLQASGCRHRAVVTFRPTGWSHTALTRSGGCPKAWEENGGATRIYGVPYSEHSSYPELQALVAALRPRAVVPTVNAETAVAREQLQGLFAPAMDLSQDQRRLDWHFGAGAVAARQQAAAAAAPAAAASASGSTTDGGDGGWPLAAEEVERQRALYRQLSRGGDGSRGDDHDDEVVDDEATATGTAAGNDEEVEDEAAYVAIREVTGPLPPRYLRSLRADSGGDVQTALAIHFGANGGTVPAAFVRDAPGSAEAASISSSSASASSAAATAAAAAADDGHEMPVGCVAWVLGDKWRLYVSREALEGRLLSLGAAVVRKGSRHSKQEVTHIVVPEGTEAGAVPRSVCPAAHVVTEAWVVRRVRALQAGLLVPPSPPKPLKQSGKKRTAGGSGGSGGGGCGGSGGHSGGEKRAARERRPSAASAMRLHRALSERLYLVERRDASEASASGLVSLRAEFAVLGSTGNVYRVQICRTPSCTCVDHKERKVVCKHMLFVYHKVLKTPHDSHVPVQSALLRVELRALLALEDGDGGDGAASSSTAAHDDEGPPLASRAVREAYARSVGGDGAVVEVEAPLPRVAARPLGEEVCMVCFDELEAEAASDVLAEAEAEAKVDGAEHVCRPSARGRQARMPATTHCALGCGRNFHAACMSRWFAARADAASRPSCPACRAAWRVDDGLVTAIPTVAAADAAAEGCAADEGFLNLAALQPGVRAARDQSSYSEWIEVHHRRREQAVMNGVQQIPQQPSASPGRRARQ